MGQEQMAINTHSKAMKMTIGNHENSESDTASRNVCSFYMYRTILFIYTYKYTCVCLYICICTELEKVFTSIHLHGNHFCKQI